MGPAPTSTTAGAVLEHFPDTNAGPPAGAGLCPYFHEAVERLPADERDVFSLIWYHEVGQGVPKDEKRARALYVQACDGGNGLACRNIGKLYDQGKGVERSESEAAKFFDRACELNQSDGCYRLARAYEGGKGVQKDEQRAARLSCA